MIMSAKVFPVEKLPCILIEMHLQKGFWVRIMLLLVMFAYTEPHLVKLFSEGKQASASL